MKPVGDMTDEELAGLRDRERQAFLRLIDDVLDGEVHINTSLWDLTPAQLVREYGL